MRFVKQQLDEVSKTSYPLTREPDFDDFWGDMVRCARNHDSRLTLDGIPDNPFPRIKIYDATQYALDGTPLKAWLYLPEEASAEHPVPAVISFHGGNGSRGDHPISCLHYVHCGCAVLQTEFRLQSGVTSSYTPMQRGILQGSWITNNIESPDPHDHYFYHAFSDQLLWVQSIFRLPQIRPDKVAVMGASQGGGTSMIMAALEPRISLCLPAVPSYCCWERRIFTRTASGGDLAKYIERFPERMEQVFRTMSYFDALNHAERISCPVKMQIALRDEAAPPDCAFAAYNRIVSPKSVKVNYFGQHHDVDTWQWLQDIGEFCS